MLRHLHLKDVGPSRRLDFEFAPRLNVLTGDNGLGKTFVLDVAWWALTGSWSGEKAFPWRPATSVDPGPIEPKISGTVASSTADDVAIGAWYEWRTQHWRTSSSQPADLVLYARIDGGFAVWDEYQVEEGWQSDDPTGSVVLLNPAEVWDGKETEDPGGRRRAVCRGLLEDWVTWQGTRSSEFAALTRVLAVLSDPAEPLVPGPPTRVHLADRRDIPTLEMSYGVVPVAVASAGQRRVLALAYMLVWAWTEHRKAAAVTGQAPTSTFVVLIDEVELHLHPRWQRLLLPALLQAIEAIAPAVSVQLIATTHAPLVLASLEPLFDEDIDNLYRFERTGPTVRVENLGFAKQGDAANWLVSETFGLDLPRSAPSEAIIQAARAFMRDDLQSAESGLQRSIENLDPPFSHTGDLKDRLHAALVRLLPDHDRFWPRWIVSYERTMSDQQE
jgi:hypothetical protein